MIRIEVMALGLAYLSQYNWVLSKGRSFLHVDVTDKRQVAVGLIANWRKGMRDAIRVWCIP